MKEHAPGKSALASQAQPLHAPPSPGKTTLVSQTHRAPAQSSAQSPAHAEQPEQPTQPLARGSLADIARVKPLAKPHDGHDHDAKHDDAHDAKHGDAKHDKKSPEDEELDRENDEDVQAGASSAHHSTDQEGNHPRDHKPNTAQKHGGGEIHIITRAGLRHLRQAGRDGRHAARVLYNNPNAFIVLKEGQQIPSGWKCKPTILFPSYAEFKAAVDGGRIPRAVEAVVYDNEHWAQTPHNEKTDAAHYAKLFGQLAHSHGWTFIAAPTRKWFAADARYADIIDVQLQSREVHKQSYLNTLKHDAKHARHLNPDIKVVAQISSNKNHLDPDHSGNIGAGIHKAESEILESEDYVDGFWGYLYQRNHKSVKAGQKILTDLADKKEHGHDI
ncbi:MAG TPA: hypothetical protein VL326_00875 [Kofleriaceae bacterium]|nr:hypothetical protein [Kofleriaceae bacterium]